MKELAKITAAISTVAASLVLTASKVMAQSDYDWNYSYDATPASSGSLGMLTGMSLLCQIPLCLVGLASFAFTIWMIVDAVKRDDQELPGKVKWILLIFFTGWIGALVYFFTRKKKMDAAAK